MNMTSQFTTIKDHDPLYQEPTPGRTFKIREVQAEDGGCFMFGVEIFADGGFAILTHPFLSLGKGLHYASLSLQHELQSEDELRKLLCRRLGLPKDSPSDLVQRVLRYSFLCGYAARNDTEEAEVQELQKDLEALTGWPVVPRIVEGPDLDTFRGTRFELKLPPGRLP